MVLTNFELTVGNILAQHAVARGAKLVSFGRSWPDSPIFIATMERDGQRIIRKVIATPFGGEIGVFEYGESFTPPNGRVIGFTRN